jgi:hypothetical protein
VDTPVKDFLRRLVPAPLYTVAKEVLVSPRLTDLEQRMDWATTVLSRHAFANALPETPGPISINDFELKIHSQNGEDGILLFLFSQIGTTDRRFVEFGAGEGRICNTANLSRRWGWSGLLMEARASDVESARRNYADWLGSDAHRVTIRRQFITAENINEVLQTEGFNGPIDVLSVDIDGNDYWVWKAIHQIEPRVVVIEYNASFGPKASVTIPYDSHFDAYKVHVSGIFHGASLAALRRLGQSKGYALVGCDSRGVNAFFIRKELLPVGLRALDEEAAWFPHADRCRTHSQARQQALLSSFPTKRV